MTVPESDEGSGGEPGDWAASLCREGHEQTAPRVSAGPGEPQPGIDELPQKGRSLPKPSGRPGLPVAAAATRKEGVYAMTRIVPSMSSWPSPQNTSQWNVNVPTLLGTMRTRAVWPGMMVALAPKSGALKPMTTSLVVNCRTTGSLSLTTSSSGA